MSFPWVYGCELGLLRGALLQLFKLGSKLFELRPAETGSHLVRLQHEVEVADFCQELALLRGDLIGDHCLSPSLVLSPLTSALSSFTSASSSWYFR